ncbi:MAG: epoxyqueuosine reductase QueH [Lachnospiraceae bacterium]|nr:epoxyqueuosine reductase QueH [Lachnospiraceae bacterium]
MDDLIEELQKTGEVPALFLHSCCGPCSSYVFEYLSNYFAITDFYYNPNIYPKEEYEKRVVEIKKLIDNQPHKHEVGFIEGKYDPDRFFEAAKDLEKCPEGGDRCKKCFELRLRETAKVAKEHGIDLVTTTLTISPMKNADMLNEIGERVCKEEGVKWLPSDFKKKGGYQRSIELSKEYDLYRQNYCGCIFSKNGRCTRGCVPEGADRKEDAK